MVKDLQSYEFCEIYLSGGIALRAFASFYLLDQAIFISCTRNASKYHSVQILLWHKQQA